MRRLTGDGDRLYIPMPFFWVGGFGTGCSPPLVAGATLLTEARPEPARTLPFLERQPGHALPRLARPGRHAARDPGFAATDLSALRPGSLDAVMPAEVRAGPGRARGLLGMTESFGPYSGYRLDQTLPAGKEGSCGQVFDGVELRVVDLDTGAPVADGETGELQLRGPNLIRGICGRTPTEVFTDDGYSRPAISATSMPTGSCSSPAAGTTCSRCAARPCTRARSKRALHALPAVRHTFVVDVAGPAGARGGRHGGGADRRRRQRRAAIEGLARDARAAAQLVQGPDPLVHHRQRRRAHDVHGKVDKAGLQQLFDKD